jgi:hypothetical protein
VPIGTLQTITLGGTGTWTYASGGGGGCLHSGSFAPGWTLGADGTMSFTATTPGSSSTWTICNLTLQNGEARTTWSGRYILPNPSPAFTGPADLGTVFGGSSSTFVSIPVSNASSASVVSGTLPGGLALSRISDSELRLTGSTAAYAQDQIHTFTIRIASQNGNNSSVRPEELDRTFTLRASPRPAGLSAWSLWSHGIWVNTVPIGTLQTITLGGTGTWTYASGGGGGCLYPGSFEPGWTLGADGTMSFTATTPGSGSTSTICNLTLQNGEARTTWGGRYILPTPVPSFASAETNLGTLYGGGTGSLISIPVVNAMGASIVAGALPAGLTLTRVSETELRITGAPANVAQEQLHTFTVRIQAQAPNTSIGSPILVERTFTLRVHPQPAGMWGPGAGSQLLLPAGQAVERVLDAQGTWTWSTSGGGACPTPGLTLGTDGRISGVPIGAWTATCDLRVQTGQATTIYGNRTLSSQP